MVIHVRGVRRGAGCTTLAAALGIIFSVHSSYSVLLIDANSMFTDMDSLLCIQYDTCMDDVLDLIDSNRCNPELLVSLSAEIGSLNVIVGSKDRFNNKLKEKPRLLSRFVKAMENIYDIIIIDSAPVSVMPTNSFALGFPAIAGEYNVEGSFEESAVLELCVLNHDVISFENYLKYRPIERSNCIVVVNRFRNNAKNELSKLSKQYGMGSPILTVRNSERLINEANDRKFEEFILNEEEGFHSDLKELALLTADKFKLLLKKSYTNMEFAGRKARTGKNVSQQKKLSWFYGLG